MPATTNDWTVEMLDALPDDGQRYEIIDGELFVTPAPSQAHQLVAGALYVRLRDYLKPHRVGRAMISSADVWRGERRRNRVQPDVFVVRFPGEWPEYPYEMHNLLLAVEVVSPGSRHLDHEVKRALYLGEGVGEYWLIDPHALNVSRWRGRDDPGDVLSTALEWQPQGMAAPFIVDLAEFFEEAMS